MSEGNRTALSKWRSPFPFVYCVVIFVVYLDQTHFCHASTTSHSAKFNITYRDLKTNTYKTDIREMGSYGVNGDKSTRAGQLVHVRTKENKTDGCTDIVNYLQTSWIALVQRGTCEIGDKIDICAKRFNASAVILYNNEKDDVLISGDKDVVSVFISKRQGLELARLVDYDPDRKVFVEIQKGQLIPTGLDTGNVNPANISKTSVLFVSISFIVLMIISLAWLVFYYIQRFRYAHAKERLTRRLASAAKKAIAKIPQRTIKSGDKELESEFDQCAVCIEGYKASDVIRILPCKHIFHKSCVDPWLLDMRSCPMCKLDILREYGMQVHLNSSQETVHAEAESGATGSGIADDAEQLSSPDEHGSQEGMDIVLIRHPSLQYHGSDTFCSTDVIQEHQVLNPQPIECNTDIITEVDIDSESECTELNSLMTGLPRKGSLHDSHSKA